ncbi:MAG: DnaD domain protein [Bacilli bacterium]
MSNVNIMPLDTFTVINRTILHNSDRKSLTMLYQPIVGSIAINLYFTFWTYLEQNDLLSEVTTHKQLINYMGVSLKEIEDARKHLEAVGLIKTFVKKGEINDYRIELYSPQPAYDFFSNPLLCTSLETALGTLQYNKTKNHFKIPKIELIDYEDISESFSNLYQASSNFIIDTSNIRKRNFNTFGVKSDIDIEKLILRIPEITANHIEVPRKVSEIIVKLCFLYRFSEPTYIELIGKSVIGKNRIDSKILASNFANYYKFENNNRLPTIIRKTQPIHLRKDITKSDSKSKQIYMFETTDPISFLCMKNKVKKLSDIYIDILNHLMVDIELNPGVINVLIEYVLKISDNKLNKNFISAIANNWKSKDIKTVEQAMDIAREEFQRRTKGTFRENKRTFREKEADVPEWFDKDIVVKEDLNKSLELESMINNL